MLIAVSLLAGGCTASGRDQRGDEGYRGLGEVKGHRILARLEGDQRIQIRMRGKDGLLCDASGPVSVEVLVCDSGTGSRRALALAVPISAAAVTLNLGSEPVSLEVLATPEGWPVTVAATVATVSVSEAVQELVVLDAAGRVLHSRSCHQASPPDCR